MSIIMTLSSGQFVFELRQNERFKDYSSGMLETFYDYLEGLSEGIGEPIEFDPVAFNCDYWLCSGLEEAREAAEELGVELEEVAPDDVEAFVEALQEADCYAYHDDKWFILSQNC